MRTLIIAFAFLALTACSGNRQAKTVSEFEDRNPYAKLTQDSALPDGNRVRIYHDLVPRITASGHYSTELRTAFNCPDASAPSPATTPTKTNLER
jgi:hypothetical protein